MQLKDIVVCIANAETDDSPFALAEQIASASGAHVACSAIGILQTVLLYNEFGRGAAYIEQLNAEKAHIDRFWAETSETLEKAGHKFELRRHRTYQANLESLVAAIARHADLTILRAPDSEHPQPQMQMIEAALLGSGRPVLIAPRNWQSRPVGHKVIAAWDASREAARAIHDALSLLSPGAEMTIVTVDAQPGNLKHGDAPGLDIAAHMARHGLKVDLRNEASLGRSTHEILSQVATDIHADMMVLGGYRHSRIQQVLFGGVTRSLLRDVSLPMLLSH